MTTLTTAPLAPLLDRLFAEADASEPLRNPAFAGLSDDDRVRMMRNKAGYRDLYGKLAEFPLAVSRETGTLLYMLARGSRARTVVEFGTSWGVSTLFLAAALRDGGGGGRVVTTEFEPGKVARARNNATAAGLADLIEFREGDALQTLARDLPPTIDLLLLDGAKALYLDVLDLLQGRLRPGALVVADDADMCPGYLDRVRPPGSGFVSTPVGEDVELSMRVG